MATAESRIRTAKRAGDLLEDLACKAFPREDAPHALAKYLATDEGQAAYAKYMKATKPTLAAAPTAQPTAAADTSSALKDLAARAYSGEPIANAGTKFLGTPEGRAAYSKYVAALKSHR